MSRTLTLPKGIIFLFAALLSLSQASIVSAGADSWKTNGRGSGNTLSLKIDTAPPPPLYTKAWVEGRRRSPARAGPTHTEVFAPEIEPSVAWNTFLGGSDYDYSTGIAVDGSGNTYVMGYSWASWGSPIRAYSGDLDISVAKLDSSGALIWNTFLGGGSFDIGWGIGVDGSGNVYVGGYCESGWGSPIRSFSGYYDACVAKLNSSGALTWNTFLGGGDEDLGIRIAVDGSGNVYVSGESYATWGSPVNAYTYNSDAFAAKLDTNGNLIWNTFLGGNDYEAAWGIAVDGSGNVHLTGRSYATWGSPVRAYTYDGDAFAAELNSAGGLTWNTFLGGYGYDNGDVVAVDGSGNVYVTGFSDATWGSPIRAYTDITDALVAKLDSSGNLVWNTFLGGAGEDYGFGIAADGSGNVYVAGYSEATWGSPVRPFSDILDAFAAKLDPSGGLTRNTFLGGAGVDYAGGIAVYGNENIYMEGDSDAVWGNPVRAFTDYADIFAAKLVLDPPGAFSKAAPADASFVTTTSPTLSWDASSNADFYIYCVDTIDNGICDTTWVYNGESTSAALSGLTNTETYYWFVAATNAIGTTYADAGVSPWWSFTIQYQSFADVPISYWAWPYIERLYSSGITGGCATSPLRYCPNASVTRAEMSIFLERGMNGSAYTPPGATGTVFGDVPISYWAAAWIEQLYADGITGGCGGGNYCPAQAVTRAEMAIFLLRAEHGSSYTPPAATGTVFGDVPISHWAAAWIEQLYAEGITGGCGGGNYCPNQAVTRAEMAIFLVRTFNLP